MCTALILTQAHPAAGLILAANRDELYARPTAPPGPLRGDPLAIGGRDLKHGGTWLGVNEAGLVALLTNMRSFDESRKSRGQLVLDVLGCRHPDEVDVLLGQRASGGEYRPFNLLYGTADTLHVAYGRDDGLTIDPVPPGLHVLPSGAHLDDRQSHKVVRGQRALRALDTAQPLDGLVDSLFEALADHDFPNPDDLPAELRRSDFGPEIEARVQAVCVHTPSYGTRSSAIIVLGPGERRYYYAGGPPCQTGLTRVDGQLG